MLVRHEDGWWASHEPSRPPRPVTGRALRVGIARLRTRSVSTVQGERRSSAVLRYRPVCQSQNFEHETSRGGVRMRHVQVSPPSTDLAILPVPWGSGLLSASKFSKSSATGRNTPCLVAQEHKIKNPPRWRRTAAPQHCPRAVNSLIRCPRSAPGAAFPVAPGKRMPHRCRTDEMAPQ